MVHDVTKGFNEWNGLGLKKSAKSYSSLPTNYELYLDRITISNLTQTAQLSFHYFDSFSHHVKSCNSMRDQVKILLMMKRKIRKKRNTPDLNPRPQEHEVFDLPLRYNHCPFKYILHHSGWIIK